MAPTNSKGYESQSWADPSNEYSNEQAPGDYQQLYEGLKPNYYTKTEQDPDKSAPGGLRNNASVLEATPAGQNSQINQKQRKQAFKKLKLSSTASR